MILAMNAIADLNDRFRKGDRTPVLYVFSPCLQVLPLENQPELSDPAANLS